MDGNLSVLYPNCNIPLFGSVNGNLVDHFNPHLNNRGFTSRVYHYNFQNIKTGPLDFAQKYVSGRTTFMCPKCHSCYSENGNWCSGCGELLIGAEVCPSDEQKRFSTEVSTTQTNKLNPSDFSTNMSSSMPINFHMPCENNVHSHNLIPYPLHTPLPFSTDAAFSLPSYTTAAFSAEDLKTRHSMWSDFSFSPSRHFDSPYHINKSIPFCILTEPSCSKYENFGIFPNVASDQQQYPVQVNEDYTNSYSKISYPKKDDFIESSVWNSQNFKDNQNHSKLSQTFNNVFDDRQRCVSGSLKQNKLASNHNSFGNVCHSNTIPSNCHLTSNTSPVRSLLSSSAGRYAFQDNSWSNSSASQIVADLLRETQNSVSADTSIPSKTSLYHLWPYQKVVLPSCKSPSASHTGLNTRGGFCRRKHPSECSKTQLNNLASVQNPGICRARSFSSDFEDNCSIHPVKSQPHWQSSRTAWSAHNPAVLKKKPAAYLRASCSQGSVASDHLEHNTNMKLNATNAQTDKSHRLPVSRTNNSSCGQKVESNNTVNSSANNTLERNGTCTKANHHQHPPRRRNRRYVSKSLSVCMDSTISNNTIISVHKEETSVDIPANKINEPNNEIILPNWLLLPDELWIEVLRYLSPVDRVRVAQTCRHLSTLSMDRSLWRVIHLHRQHHLTDSDLVRIGNFKPKELRFTYCRGDSLTATGLKRMFLVCGPGLQKLSLIGCTKGPFDQDLPLRIVADHCHNLKYVNASYTQSVRDQTVIALAKSATHLISVKLNGAQQISNAAIQQLVHYHQNTLERLELFGCFRLNSSILALLGRCQGLRALAFGHLHHLTSDGLLDLVSKLPHLSSLDLRGTQTFSDDDNLSELATKCPHLEEVVLANMHSLKRETGIAQMLRHLPRLRVLDLCGLAVVGDLTMEVLATSCPQLEELDVSCTSVTQKGLFHLTNAPAVSLKCLRISHCREITTDVLEKLIEACPKLTLLYAYGFVSIDDWGFLQRIRPTLLVEKGI
ncbi:F-box/LRR-repeat protein [Schistosoma japonicum]|uniref:F-box/LRR-repeat protein n=1 Tax=Schistosoma japonicum TaxID=6182 RepID=C7TZ26_SCHJA|nr:F-box/LRR-repeat protein [Schistosoma japonicum]CAX82852.1 putative leucine-rich repeats containing F-box protein FBL3 [Schistosoma japonicum]